MSELRMRVFVHNYLQTGMNAAAAARLSGYAESDAKNAGYRLLQSGRVQELLAEAAEEALRQLAVKSEDVLRMIYEIAAFDPADVFKVGSVDAKGRARITLRELFEMPAAARRCIKEMDVLRTNLDAGDGQRDTVVRIKFHGKLPALDMLARHRGLLLTPEHGDAHSAAALARMSDEDLLRVQREGLDRFERHVQAQRKRLAAVADAEIVTKGE